MKTLFEHNKEAHEAHVAYMTYPKSTGIACPECDGGELYDTDGSLLCSSPPQKNVVCISCGWKGYRLA